MMKFSDLLHSRGDSVLFITANMKTMLLFSVFKSSTDSGWWQATDFPIWPVLWCKIWSLGLETLKLLFPRMEKCWIKEVKNVIGFVHLVWCLIHIAIHSIYISKYLSGSWFWCSQIWSPWTFWHSLWKKMQIKTILMQNRLFWALFKCQFLSWFCQAHSGEWQRREPERKVLICNKCYQANWNFNVREMRDWVCLKILLMIN